MLPQIFLSSIKLLFCLDFLPLPGISPLKILLDKEVSSFNYSLFLPHTLSHKPLFGNQGFLNHLSCPPQPRFLRVIAACKCVSKVLFYRYQNLFINKTTIQEAFSKYLFPLQGVWYSEMTVSSTQDEIKLPHPDKPGVNVTQRAKKGFPLYWGKAFLSLQCILSDNVRPYNLMQYLQYP